MIIFINWIKNLFNKSDNGVSLKLEANSYKKWSTEEDEHLIKMIDDGLSIEDVSYLLERSQGSVYSRYRKLKRGKKL